MAEGQSSTEIADPKLGARPTKSAHPSLRNVPRILIQERARKRQTVWRTVRSVGKRCGILHVSVFRRPDSNCLACLQPRPEQAILGGAGSERTNEETRIQMDHGRRRSRRSEDARRCSRTRRLQALASDGFSGRDRWSAFKAARASLRESAPPALAARMARRSASDLDTPQRRAIPSRSRIVSKSRVYVLRTIGVAILLYYLTYASRQPAEGSRGGTERGGELGMMGKKTDRLPLSARTQGGHPNGRGERIASRPKARQTQSANIARNANRIAVSKRRSCLSRV